MIEMPQNVKVSLFITCLVDVFFPQVGESMVKVLRKLGVEVDFPEDQTCCGQPAFNSGFRHDAKALGERFISVFDGDGFIVSPSGSCTSMVKVFYRELFRNDPGMLKKVNGILLCRIDFDLSTWSRPRIQKNKQRLL